MKKKVLATTADLSIGLTTFGGVTSTFAAYDESLEKQQEVA